MRTIIKNILCILAMAGFTLACKPGDKPSGAASIELDQEEITTDFNGGTYNIKVTANIPTKTTITYSEGDGWIFLTPAVLKGDGVLSFQISKFLDYDVTRTATATIEGSGVTKKITIKQDGRPKPQATELDLDKYNVYADVEGGSYEITVSTAGDWTAISSAPEWCSVSDGSAIGVGKFTITVSESTDYKYRTAEVKVVAGQLERTVLVQHVGTKIGDIVWANANVDDPDTFGRNCEVRGKLYQWNQKIGFPSYSADDHGDPDTIVPGYTGGAVDSHSETWTEENDPCPDGWRVPTMAELKALIGENGQNFYFDYWKTMGMSVAGVYAGIDKETIKAECKKGHLNGAIFIPQAGRINRDTCKQDNWWNVMLWSCENVGQTWDMHGVWLDGEQGYNFEDWHGSMEALSVRCVLK